MRLKSAVLVVGVAGILTAQRNVRGAMAEQHMGAMAGTGHRVGVNQRGDEAMGFSHKKTTHHFLLAKDGGSIQVEAKDAGDIESRDQIRMHLGHIAKMFAVGNFDAPMLIHEQVPPGVAVMKQKSSQIGYRFENTTRGGRVRIFTKNPAALRAIHEFLRFQIQDHGTGDSTEIGRG